MHFQQGKPKELKAVEYPELKRGERERERERGISSLLLGSVLDGKMFLRYRKPIELLELLRNVRVRTVPSVGLSGKDKDRMIGSVGEDYAARCRV